MNLDRLIDQTFPSLEPTCRGRYSDLVSPDRPLRERQTSSSVCTRDDIRKRSGWDNKWDTAASSKCAESVETSTFRGLEAPFQLSSADRASLSPVPTSSASKLRSFFRSSPKTTSTRSFPRDEAEPSPSSSNIRANSTYSSNLALSPAARNTGASFPASGPQCVGQSPCSRPSTPCSVTSTATRGPRRKNLSIWSLSPSVFGGGRQSLREDNVPVGFDEEGSSTRSRSRSRQESLHSSASSSPSSLSRPSPSRTLSCLGPVAPSSPPLDPTLFVPQTRSKASVDSRPSTPRRNVDSTRRYRFPSSVSGVATATRDRSESASTVSSSRTGSTSPGAARGGPDSTTTAATTRSLKKTLSSLLLHGSDRSSSPLRGGADEGHHDNTSTGPGKRSTRKRTASKGGVGLFGIDGGGGHDGDELTEEEIRSWRLSNLSDRHRRVGTTSSFSSIEKLGLGDSGSTTTRDLEFARDGRRRRTSSNRSFLDGPDFAFGSSDRSNGLDDSASSDEDEVLIIDKTKSKGFSTLLGGEYETFYSASSQTPTATSFTFTQLPVSTLSPAAPLETVEISPSTPTTAVFASPRRTTNRLSQLSTNSDEALWLDAAATTSFPSSPLPPPPSVPSVPPPPEIASSTTTKPVKHSAFSSSLVNPTQPPSSPAVAPSPSSSPTAASVQPQTTTTTTTTATTARRASLIPLSPRVAQLQTRGRQDVVDAERVTDPVIDQAGLGFAPMSPSSSPSEFDSERHDDEALPNDRTGEQQGGRGRGRESAAAAVEGLMIDYAYKC